MVLNFAPWFAHTKVVDTDRQGVNSSSDSAASETNSSSDNQTHDETAESLVNPPAATERQATHKHFLLDCGQKSQSTAMRKRTCNGVSGRTPEYCKWWQEKSKTQCEPFFMAQLIGDASTPEKHTPLTFGDLAYCR